MHYFLFVWPTAHQFSVELRSSEMTALVMAGAACRGYAVGGVCFPSWPADPLSERPQMMRRAHR